MPSNWTVRAITRALKWLFSLLAKKNWNFFSFDLKKEPYISQILILLKLWLIIGNRNEWSPIQPVLILVIKQIGLPRLLITHMITDRTGLQLDLLPLLTVHVLYSNSPIAHP